MTQPTHKYTYPDLLWAGTEHSLDLAIHADQRINAFVQPQAEQQEEGSYLLSKQDGVGIISIRGPLVSRDSPANRYYGVTSYAEVRRALVEAASDPSIEGVLLDIDSGGGAVNGVADTGDLIKTIDRQVKPVWAYTEGTMASAAYWLGSSARQVYASKTAITGSVGVILTHMEYSKMAKEMGIGVTVMRAGEYKALANSMEPLSEMAQRQLQDQLNSAYGVFINHVADARGTTENLADQRMGQGREFFGEQAVTAGLIDGIASFDTILSRFSSKLLDNGALTHSNSGQYQRGNDMKRALTEKQLAALAAGANPAAAAELPTEPAAAEEKPATETPAASVASPEDAATTAAAAETLAPASTGTDPVVAFLQQQLAASQDQIVDLRLQLSSCNDTINGMKTTHAGLMEIAARSLSNMKVALGLPATDASKLSPETLLAEHAATTETFQKAFKAGGVAAVNTETKPAALLDPHLMRRVQATRLSSN